jgi:hypothetical protein
MDTQLCEDDAQAPRTRAPAGASDSHMHIHDRRFLVENATTLYGFPAQPDTAQAA